MTANPKTIKPDDLAERAVAVMNERKITCLFALTHGRPEGILHIHDCLRAGVV
jgi:arabinose-5-phosphate isomerase